MALTLAMVLPFAGCSKRPPQAPSAPATKYALYRGYGFWFQDLVARFKKEANPPGQPPRYELVRLPDFDPLGPEMAQQTAMQLSSVYPVTALSFGARASEMLQAVDVIISNTAWVPEFARNGWLAPFDEAVVGPILREAGVEPVRVPTRGEDPKSAPIYGIPITRAADFLFYRKSYFHNEEEARAAWAALFESGVQNPKSRIQPPPFIAADGQEIHRLFLPLVWSLEPDWPLQADGTLVADTPAARRVLGALHRSM
ncbi:MAG: extracellular solute-binding protein, partial [Verrucomicrobiae bacterium]|nr:extracellular solute-binding protein [Verrucomicrobiae bacterium]